MFVLASMAAETVSGLVKVRNMSSEGALIESAALPHVGEHLSLRRGELAAAGRIVWREGGRAGLRFDDRVEVAAWLPAGAAAMPEVQAVMEAYRAAAARDLGTLGARAEAVLQLDPKVVAPPLREQMLVLAMSAAAAVDDDARVRALEDRYGGGADMSKLLTGTRVFALAWADGNRASCHARRSGAPR